MHEEESEFWNIKKGIELNEYKTWQLVIECLACCQTFGISPAQTIAKCWPRVKYLCHIVQKTMKESIYFSLIISIKNIRLAPYLAQLDFFLFPKVRKC